MRAQENYTPFIAVGLALTLAILITFQIYLFQEPGRIQADEATNKLAAEIAGQDLYAEHCATCHGTNGQGVSGPALNSRELLTLTTDDPAEPKRSVIIRNNAHLVVRNIRFVVERQELFPRLAQPGSDMALQLIGIIDVQGPASVE